jgi:hypothetical protein
MTIRVGAIALVMAMAGIAGAQSDDEGLAAACRGTGRSAPGAVIAGTARDATTLRPLGGVEVSAEWGEVTIATTGTVRSTRRISATTFENGLFALCGAPATGAVVLRAANAKDSTDRIELSLAGEPVIRRDLYVGGDASTLRGRVSAASSGAGLAGVELGLPGGPRTRSNDRGEWTLAGVPGGTRVIEIRAVSYYPERRIVDVIAGAPALEVSLSSLQAVLDTVRIKAARINDPNRAAFEERRRSSGAGHFVTEAQIARRNPIETSDLFRALPGVRLEYNPQSHADYIVQRGIWGDCSPALYVDGLYMTNMLSADDINVMTRPADLAGIEVYPAGTVPAQYQRGLSGCGTILFWTKRDVQRRRSLTRSRAFAAGLTIGALVGLTKLVFH